MLTQRSHPETGEVCYLLRDYEPPSRFAAREKHGVHGRPHITLWVFADRVELERGWCFMSGQMEAYEEETAATFRPEGGRWPDALGPAVAEWFGERAVTHVLALLEDPDAFQDGGA